MAADSGTQNSDWKKRESFGSALVQIVIVAAVLALVVFLVVKRGNTKKEVGELLKEARTTAFKGNPNDLRAALKVAEDAVEKDGNAAEAHALVASLATDLWMLHRENGAEAKAREALTRAKANDAKSEERYGAEALHLVATGDFKAAENFVEDLRKKGANSAKLLHAQALALKAQGNLTLSRQGFTTAIDKAWKDANYSASWGEAILDEGQLGAVDTFTKALGTNPDLLRAKNGLALARVMKKDKIGDAEAMVAGVLSRDAELSPPLKARAIAIQAHIANVATESDKAIGLAEKALGLNPDDRWALFAKANALAAKKDAAAPGAYIDLVAKAPSAPVFYFEGARHLQAAGMIDAAIALLDKYEAFFKQVKNLTADGKEVTYLERDDRYYLTRGDVLKESGKLDEAMAAYDKAIEARNVNVTKAYYSKASVFLAKKDYDKALEMLQDITPEDGTGQLAEAYMAVGDAKFAKKDFGPGCQSYVFGLMKMKAQQAPREKLNAVIDDVAKRLKEARQSDLLKTWNDEAKTFIQ
ncbi:MAG: tetratricopeptide repeat protein [Myxococcaceae bacterium]|nr:tetratricopeptide repeat protein [Myxococcaceae bacterium]